MVISKITEAIISTRFALTCSRIYPYIIGAIAKKNIITAVKSEACTMVILNSVAKRKVRFYNEKLKNLDVGMFQHGQQTGVTLKYRFWLMFKHNIPAQSFPTYKGGVIDTCDVW